MPLLMKVWIEMPPFGGPDGPGAGSGAPAIRVLIGMPPFGDPDGPGAGSGAPANENLHRNATIWRPRWPRPVLVPLLMRTLKEMLPFGGPAGQGPVLVALLIRILIEMPPFGGPDGQGPVLGRSEDHPPELP